MPGQSPVDLQTLSDLRTPWCLHVAATLRLAERIAAGTEQVEQLAAAAGCNAEALHGVLATLARAGVFEEPEPGRFVLNQAARGLLDPALHLGLDLDGIGGRMAHAWGTLLTYVRNGAPGYQQVFGLPFWEDLDAHPEIAASFDALMGPAGHGDFNPHFDLTGGWESINSVVDVGGGTGAMLAAMLRAHPHLRGTLVDLPATVARAAETFRAAGVADRVTSAAQSFFDPLPAGSDLYLLRGVVNNWPDAGAIALLKRCAEAAGPGGRVVVLKSVGEETAGARLEVDMLLVGGKPRTVPQFRKLAEQAGLEVIAAGRQASGYFVVECTCGTLQYR